ncbi:unnamed protein product [Clavelina lepadiformis]|uniref:Uncharacterized protein n=1 Tax=Clavelina lepadiformis TaxID=159417 RepID=A0ABP0GA16_CLALP
MVLRLPALDSFLSQYQSVLDWLVSLSNDFSIDSSTRSNANAHLHSMEKLSTYFMLRVLQFLLMHVAPIHDEVQRRGISVGHFRNLSEYLLIILSHFGDEQRAKQFFEKCESESRDLGIELPNLPRRSGSRNFVLQQTGNASAKEYYASLYVKVFQECCAALKKRYPQEDLTSASVVEDT